MNRTALPEWLPGGLPGRLRVHWLTVLAALSGAFLLAQTAMTIVRDFGGAETLVAMDVARCGAIARAFPPREQARVAEPCLARAQAKKKAYWGFAFAHIVSVFVVLVVGPGLTTIIVADFWRRVRRPRTVRSTQSAEATPPSSRCAR